MSQPQTVKIAPRTVIEAFLPATGSVDAALVYDAANAVAIDDQTLRVTLRRLVASGAISQEGRGRAAQLALTEAGLVALDRDRLGLNLALAQDAGEHLWDGRWRLVSISTPEAERSTRDRLRRTLAELGAASVSTALVISPHDLVELLGVSAERHLVTATAEHVTIQGTSDLTTIAEQLWPARPIDTAYDVLAEALDRDHDDTSPTLRRLRLADALERAIRHDPLIPAELRTRPWRPARLRAEWLRRWAATQDEAPAVYDGWVQR